MKKSIWNNHRILSKKAKSISCVNWRKVFMSWNINRDKTVVREIWVSYGGASVQKKTTSDHCFFVQKFSDDDFVILLLHADYILIVGRNVSRINSLKKQLSKCRAMKDLEPAKKVLEIQIVRDKASKKLYMSHDQYIEKVLNIARWVKKNQLVLLYLVTSN